MEIEKEKIKGYRVLSQDEIDTINAIKIAGNSLSKIIKGIELHDGVDLRWVAIAKTDLQKGIMALVRSVAKPEGF